MRTINILLLGFVSLGAYARTTVDHGYGHDTDQDVNLVARGVRPPLKPAEEKLGFISYSSVDYKGNKTWVQVYTRDTARTGGKLSDCVVVPSDARSLQPDKNLQCLIFMDTECQLSGSGENFGRLSGYSWNPFGTKDGWDKDLGRWYDMTSTAGSLQCWWIHGSV